jgi:hypothetical protein
MICAGCGQHSAAFVEQKRQLPPKDPALFATVPEPAPERVDARLKLDRALSALRLANGRISKAGDWYDRIRGEYAGEAPK